MFLSLRFFLVFVFIFSFIMDLIIISDININIKIFIQFIGIICGTIKLKLKFDIFILLF